MGLQRGSHCMLTGPIDTCQCDHSQLLSFKMFVASCTANRAMLGKPRILNFRMRLFKAHLAKTSKPLESLRNPGDAFIFLFHVNICFPDDCARF